jgi:hypothetical protein
MMIDSIFKIQDKVRDGVLYIISSLPFDKLTIIPNGFSNNILWNAGHIISVQQSLVYGLTGNQPLIDQTMLVKFKKDSFPNLSSAMEDFEWIKENIIMTVEKTKSDYKSGLFTSVPNPYITMLTNELTTVEDCFQMAVFHDSIHFDRIRAFKRMLD